MTKKETPEPRDVRTDNSARAQLREFVRLIEDEHDEMTNLRANVAGHYREAKAAGLDVKAIRQVVRLRAMDQAKRAELEDLVELYEEALR